MTVDSQNIEAVSSRTKPVYINGPTFSQAVLSCPKCSAAMEPMLLAVNDDGTQPVWWTCSEVKTKKCFFPLNMPQDVFWVTRSAQDIEKDEVPPPNLSNLPVRYQYLYPSLFQRSTRKTTHESRQGSHESTRSVSSMESGGSSTSTNNSASVWDTEDGAKNRTAVKLNAMAKPKVVLTEKKTFIPSFTGGNRALAFAESYREDARASTSIASRLKMGNPDKKISAESRELAKKKVIQMLSGVQPAHFKKIGPTHVHEIKKAVIEHVKKRRAERDQLAELKKINEERNKIVDINDLVRTKLLKNKREYEQMRLEKAREARIAAARVSKTARMNEEAGPVMPGYGEEEEEVHPTDHASYAVTPPYMSGATSPIPGTSSFTHDDGQFPQEYDFGGEDYVNGGSSSGMEWSDHSGEMPSFGNDDTSVVSPFAELGHLDEDDLMGIEGDQQFDRAFEAIADSFVDDYGDDFSDLSQYN